MRKSAALLGILISLGLPSFAGAWGNEETHLRLTNAAVRHSDRMEQTLREVYGLPEGLETMLAPQRGFARDAGLAAVDEDLGQGVPLGSRFNRDRSLAALPPFGSAPEDSRIQIANGCEGPPGTPETDAGFDEIARQRHATVRLLRAGAYARDNSDIRASNLVRFEDVS